ncbi:putative adipose-regulatory protein-domain-containing protein [Tuber brumale]|nr:putative adipose-regulatory protein-domain-containing protein [Tuber brumale]
MAEITIYSTPLSPSSSASAPGMVIATGRRGGLMPWRSPIARTAHTLLRLPLLLFLPNTKEEEAVRVVLLENVVFGEPARHAVVSLESRSRLDVYEAKVEFRARLAGIRWIMWRWRILSFFLGSGLFFAVEVLAMGVVWWAVYGWFTSSGTLTVPGGGRYLEGEDETAEEEEGDGVGGVDDLGFATPESLEADDEDEGEGDDEVLLKSDVGDSGIGGLSESLGTTTREKSAGGASGSGGSRRRRTRLG